jgi:hypothetical protein
MSRLAYRSDFPDRKIVPLEERREQQAIQGSEAMAEYARKADAVLEQMAKLRAERKRRQALSEQDA